MKILVVANAFYDNRLQSNKNSVTGHAIMIRDIFDGVSEKHKCYMLLTRYNKTELMCNSITILSNNYTKRLSAICRNNINLYYYALRDAKHKGLRSKIRVLFNIAVFEYYYKMLKPDIVNFHDLNEINTPIMLRCLREKRKIILTDHLYIGTHTPSYGYQILKKEEEEVFLKPNNEFYVSFVSNGMMKRFKNDYPFFPHENIFCIVNGTNIAKNNKIIDIVPEIFKRFQERKVLLCIGNMMKRKNQQQIISAIKNLNPEQAKDFAIVFIGGDSFGELSQMISLSGKSDILYYVGKVAPEEMCYYYSNCFATITTSLNESFGLTIIEGFTYGKPAILFDDLDSFDDLYDKKTCVPIRGHADNDIINAIYECLYTNWDSSYISDYANKFSIKRVHQDYSNLFETLCRAN